MINDYHKNYFWVCPDELGRKKYYFNIKGNFIEVDKDVFNVCYSSYKKQLRDMKKEMEVDAFSLNEISRHGIETLNIVGTEVDYIGDLYNRDLVTQIMQCINELDEKDKELITNLLIKEKTERELAGIMNISQPSVHKRKNRIIKKIREKVKK